MQIKRDLIFDPSLVLYLPLWKLDGASFMSKDAYGHLCTATGALWRPYGRWFDGVDDKIQIPNHASLNFGASTDFTLEAWIEEPATTFGVILAKGQAAGGSKCYRMNVMGGGQGYAAAFIDDGTTNVPIISTTPVNDGNSHHIVCSFTRTGNGVLYVDGLEVESADISAVGDIDDVAQPLYIGRRGWAGSPAWLNATIGEVRIYSRALTPLEIQHNYLATKWGYR